MWISRSRFAELEAEVARLREEVKELEAAAQFRVYDSADPYTYAYWREKPVITSSWAVQLLADHLGVKFKHVEKTGASWQLIDGAAQAKGRK